MYQHIPSRHGPISCPFRHFLPQKAPKKSHRKRELEFLETQTTTRALVFSALLTVENLRRSTSRTLLVTLAWIAFGCVHKLYLKESDCVPAVHRPKFVTKTGFIAHQ